MKIVLGVLEIGFGLYVFIRHKHVAARGANFNQRIARAVPWYAWRNPNVSDEAWRYMAPAIGIAMIAIGILILVLVPSH
jgi:hypothetical protein